MTERIDEALLEATHDEIVQPQQIQAQDPGEDGDPVVDVVADAHPSADDLKSLAEKGEEGGIPKERFNQVWAEKKALEEELKSLRKPADTTAESQSSTAELRKMAFDALMEGDAEKYAELQERADNAIQDAAAKKAYERFENVTREREGQNEFSKAVASLVEKYPILHAETGNKEAIEMVVDLRDAYIAKGKSASEALRLASDKIAPLFAAPEKTEPKEDARIALAVKRGVDASSRIPPQGNGVGNRATSPASNEDISPSKWGKMSREERNQFLM